MGNERTSVGARAVVLAACVLLVATAACQAPAPPAEPEGRPSPEEMDSRATEGAVIAAHRELIRAMEAGDREAVIAVLDPTPALLIFHPYLENRFDGLDEVREGLDRMFSRVKELSWTEVHPMLEVHGDVAWHTSQVLLKSPALEMPFIGRGTEIWVRRESGWRLVHGHWSEHATLASGGSPPEE